MQNFTHQHKYNIVFLLLIKAYLLFAINEI